MATGSLYDRDALERMTSGFRVAVLVTLTRDGMLRSRPMLPPEIESDGSLVFVTRRDDPKVEDIGTTGSVNVSWVDQHTDDYVSVSGRAECVENPMRIASLWTPELQRWFPRGPSDERLTLLRVEVDRIEMWDDASGRMVVMGHDGVAADLDSEEHERRLYESRARHQHVDPSEYHLGAVDEPPD